MFERVSPLADGSTICCRPTLSSRHGTHRSITLTPRDPIWLRPHRYQLCDGIFDGGAAPDPVIRNRAYDAVESPPVPRQPPHEITREPRHAWELAAFAASCRNGLVTMFNS